MPNYHVNKNAQSNGDHEVHENGCGHHPILKTGSRWGFMQPAAGRYKKPREPTSDRTAASTAAMRVIRPEAMGRVQSA